MRHDLITAIQSYIEKCKKHSNEWNIVNQLLDILTVDPSAEELVAQDLSKEGMGISDMVKKIDSKRLSNPIEVMKEICEFYGITSPNELPPEQWRNESKHLQLTAPKSPTIANANISLLDLLS